MKVLIIIDLISRELLGFINLKKKLEEKNYQVFFCNRYNFTESYNYILPKIVIAPQLYKTPGIEKIKNKSYLIYLRSESFASNVKFCLIDYLIQEKEIKPDAIFYWGKKDWAYFKKNLENYKLVEHCITGHPMNDVWNYYRKKYKKKLRKKTPKVGICSTLKSVTSGVDNYNPFKLIYDIENNRDYNNKSRFYDKKHGPEYFIAYEFNFISLIIQICKKIKFISIRPAPYEKVEHYSFLKNKYNVEIDQSSNYLDWLIKNDIILAYKSSVQITAYILGINVINLKGCMNSKILSGLNKETLSFKFDKYFDQPQNLNNLIKLIKKKQFKKNQKIENFIKNTYSFCFSSTFSSSNEIVFFLEKKRSTLEKLKPELIKNNNFSSNLILSLFLIFLPRKIIIFLKDLKILLRNLLFEKYINRQTYAFYNLDQIRRVKNKSKQIYNY